MMFKYFIVFFLAFKFYCHGQMVLPSFPDTTNAVQTKWKADTARANYYTMLAAKQPAGNYLSGVVSFANGGIGAGAATSATTGAMTVSMTTEMITVTPTGACTFNASGGVAGQRVTFLITTSGTSSFTLTWGTNFRTTGTLATGTTTGRLFAVNFICTNGTQWVETGRTAAMP